MEDDDIAAAMGFSAFGGSKKRKFDHANSRKATTDASGSNTIQLGVRNKAPKNLDYHDAGVAPQNDLGVSTEPGITPAMSDPPPPEETPPKPTTKTVGLDSSLRHGHQMQARPPSSPPMAQVYDFGISQRSDFVSFGGRLVSKTELNSLRLGVKTGTGDTAYFLPSFVEDPWEGFPKSGS